MIRKKSSKYVFESDWLKVREDEVVFEDNTEGIYRYVEQRDFVKVVPFDGEKFILIKQFRYVTGSHAWAFPAGIIDEGETPKEAAIRETEEEAGVKAGKLEPLSNRLETACGTLAQGYHIFAATDISDGEQQLEKAELGMEVGRFSAKEIEEMIADGNILDSNAILAYYLYKDQKGV